MSVGDWIATAGIGLAIFGVLSTIVGLVWWAGRWFERVNSKVEKVSEIETKLNEVAGAVAEILSFIKAKHNIQLVQRFSPIKLTKVW